MASHDRSSNTPANSAGNATVVVATNRRARHDFDIIDTFEAGLVLHGSEVKSLRESKVQLAEAYARVRGGEAWLHSLHIAPYSHAGVSTSHIPDRPKKLLLHRSEITKLGARLDQEPLTVVALALYFKNGRAKVELALARRKHKGDKRRDIATRDADREAARAMSRGRAGRPD
ncbi:MAG: SsrA-binding protein SmpB [Acidimicrobiia bacterium]|nr:SsrA-binding protein SmpB [Acidimicrobiia bacterium]